MGSRSSAAILSALGLWMLAWPLSAQPPPEEPPPPDVEEPPPPDVEEEEWETPVWEEPPWELYPVGYRGRLDFHAQYGLPVPLGGYFELSLHGAVIVRQSGGPEQLERGGGFTLRGGLHLGHWVALELAWFQSYHNPLEVDALYGRDVDYLVLDGLSVGVRFNLLPIDLVVPYLRVGLGAYALSSRFFGLDSAGMGVDLAVGVDIWLTDFLTLGVSATYRGISMGPPNAAFDDTFISMLNFAASIGFHF